jgi:predicted enzyme related to lactoylglutathione lyase
MAVTMRYVVFDCRDPRAVAEFWATALGYVIDAPNEDSAGEVLLDDPNGAGTSLGFMTVPEGKVVKNRVHIDVFPDTSMEIEVQRLIDAGASVVEERQDPLEGYIDPCVWTVMLDPEGNEFCVIEELSARP